MKTHLAIIIFFFLSQFRGLPQTFVNPAGSDITGNGTIALPYKTIQKGIDATSAGGTVHVMSGTYLLQTRINITKPLALQRYGNAPVVLDTALTGFSSGYPYSMLKIENTNNVTINGFVFQNYINTTLNALGEIAACGVFIIGRGDNITVTNCEFKNIGWTTSLTAVAPLKRNCNVIKVQGTNSATPLSNIKIIGNEVHDCATGWGEAITMVGNVNGFLIEKNSVYRIANIGIGVAGNYSYTGAAASVNQARNGIVRNNEVHHCMSPIAVSAGIYIDGGINNIVERNNIHHNGAGISIGGEALLPAGGQYTNGNIIRNNIIYDNALNGAVLGADSDFAAKRILRNHFVNNTLYKNCTGESINGVLRLSLGAASMQIQADSSPGECLLQNSDGLILAGNIVTPSNNRHCILGNWGSNTVALQSNHNLFFNEADFALASTINFNLNNLPGALYGTIAQFSTATGLESASVYGFPGFANSTTRNFNLLPCALAIDKGTPGISQLISGTLDYAGSPRILQNVRIDCGAYEYPVSPEPCSFALLEATSYCVSPFSLVRLRWNRSAFADNYEIIRNGVTIKVGLSDTLFIDTLSLAQQNTYSIRARNSVYSTSLISQNTLQALSKNCLPPQSFRLLQVIPLCVGNQAKVQLKWEPSLNANEYSIRRSDGYIQANIQGLEYADSVTPFRNYGYTVVAKNINIPAEILNSNGQIQIMAISCPADTNVFDMRVAPNPASTFTYLQITGAGNQKLGIQIFNSIGQLVKKIETGLLANYHVLNLPLQGFSSGLYFIVVEKTGTGKRTLKLIVKQ